MVEMCISMMDYSCLMLSKGKDMDFYGKNKEKGG